MQIPCAAPYFLFRHKVIHTVSASYPDITPATQTGEASLAERLADIIDKLPPDGVTLRHLLDLVGEDGLMILIVLLSLVFIIPVSIPGVSTVFGAAILLIACSRLLNCGLWLPASLREKTLSTDKLRPVFQRALGWLQRLEKISRPGRLTWLVNGRGVNLFNSASLILGAVLLMAPFGLIPFSNTLPAVALLCLAVGILQRDGGCILLGYIANVGTIVYFGVLIGGAGVAIEKGLRYFGG